MTLTAGLRLGQYEIHSALGAGGMGEVYRARDTRLDRTVAIKILPESFAHDPERLARFEREAKTLASLNHPNIAIIHGFEHAQGIQALVMELIEGPTVADRIAQGPIPLDEVLAIAKQIAGALEAAHEQGIIHRDLKPANVKLRPDGMVKVLDFGLAKASDPAATANMSQSPTLSLTGMSQIGVVLGTAAYMAPEQARGKVVDRRADIWAFGCVLYEMLTGRQAFPGDDVSQTLARVIEREPDWKMLPNDVPPVVRVFLQRCLEKDPARRVRNVGDVALALDGRFDQAISSARVSERQKSPTIWRRALPWAAALIAAATTGAAVWNFRTPAALAVTRFEVVLPNFRATNAPLVSLSPDGRTIFYVEEDQGGQTRIMRRDLSDLAWGAISGTEGADSAPFFSPDGRWMAFTVNGAVIRKVPITGGTPTEVTRVRTSLTPAWVTDETIVFGGPGGLWQVPATGGTPTVIAKTDGGASAPQRLPGTRRVLFHSTRPGTEATIEMLDLATLERREITTGRYPRYGAGHLLFMRGDALQSAPFDVDQAKLLGEPTPMPINVLRRGLDNAAPQLSLAENGTLVYIAAHATNGATLVWAGRDGTSQATRLPPGRYGYPRLSPDEKRLAVGIDGDIWVIDLERSTQTRLTYGDRAGPRSLSPLTAWSPDGRYVTFDRASQNSAKPNETTLEWRRADATAPAEVLFRSEGTAVPTSWSRDGNLLLFQQFMGIATSANRDLWILRRSTPIVTESWVATKANERAPMISPNGQWAAYVSDESGIDQIYVRPLSGAGDRQTVSTAGGTEPIWARSARELFYRGPDAMMAVSVSGTAPTLGAPVRLFDDPFMRDGSNSRANAMYDVASDGRFLMVAAPTIDNESLIVVENWLEELKRLAPAK